MADLATPKQTQFLSRLVTERDAGPGYASLLVKFSDGSLTKREASHLIDGLLSGERVQTPAAEAEAEVPEGVHVIGDEYRKAYRTQKGFLVAKVWADGAWEYVGKRGLAGLSADTVATAEQAAAFGHVTGACVFCSRELTDERSLTVGYGPVCATNHGLPWGEVAEVTPEPLPAPYVRQVAMADTVTTQEEQEARDSEPAGEVMPDPADDAYWAALLGEHA